MRFGFPPRNDALHHCRIFYFLRQEVTCDTVNDFHANITDLLIGRIFNLTVDKKLYSLGSALSVVLFLFMAIVSLAVYLRSPSYRKEDTYKRARKYPSKNEE